MMTLSNRSLLLIVLFFVCEVTLIAFVDRPVSASMHALDQTHPALIHFFRAITDIGKSKWYLWPSGLAVIICALTLRMKLLRQEVRQKVVLLGEKSLFLFACVAVSGIITDVIKPILGRARPVELVRDGVYGFQPLTFHAAWNGMPSGHSTTAFAVAAVLCLFFPKGKPLWLLLAFILAVSRIMVNAHYLSDALAGAAVGWLTVGFIHSPCLRHRIYQGIKNVFFPLTRQEK